MKLVSTFILSIGLAGAVCADKSTLDIPLKDIDGKKTNLGAHKGKVMLVVNVASKCGLTKQYKQLQAVHDKFAKKGFTVLGFPCNQFGKQEPGTSLEIKKFCTDNFSVTFPLHAKIEVNGDGACELYQQLKAAKVDEEGNADIGWNFTKFLVDRQGNVVERFVPPTTPEDIEESVLAHL